MSAEIPAPSLLIYLLLLILMRYLTILGIKSRLKPNNRSHCLTRRPKGIAIGPHLPVFIIVATVGGAKEARVA